MCGLTRGFHDLSNSSLLRRPGDNGPSFLNVNSKQPIGGAGALARASLRYSTPAPRKFDKICVVAAVQHNNGISAGARLQAEALKREGHDAQLLDVTAAIHNPLFRFNHEPADAYIYHSGGPQTVDLFLATLPHAARAYRIAYWAWELPVPPKWEISPDLFDEIWTPSVFARESLQKRYNLPIKVVPHRMLPLPERTHVKSDDFTVLVIADGQSSFTRKNPAGAVAAFKRGAGASDRWRLILKLKSKIGALDGLDEATSQTIRSMPNVEIVERHLSDGEMSALYDRSDVLLSLHRAEGFGLPMMEAAARGIPVVATGWSGNLEFLNDANAVLVPFQLVPIVDPTVYRGYGEACWADPDVAAAASELARLAASSTERRRIGDAGRQAIARLAAQPTVPE